MSATETVRGQNLEIQCAKPDCHWSGSPAEAATHDCPTPAASEEAPAAATPAPFAGMLDTDGKPIADETADRSLPYHVFWTKGVESRLLGTRATLEEVAELEASVDLQAAGGDVVVREIQTADEGEKPEPAAEIDAIEADAEPTEPAEIEAWLIAHGNYDEAGIPQDEKTARLDAQISREPTDEPEPEPEPDLEPAATEPGPDSDVVIGDPAPPPMPEDAARPWQAAIAEALEQQTAVAAHRWLVVWHPEDEAREAELIGRGKTRSDADEVLAKVVENGKLDGKTEVVKTADVLEVADAYAAEVERKRELVTDPERKVESPPPDEPAAEPEPADAEGLPDPGTEEEPPADGDEEVTKPDPEGEALFDRSSFDREDLAIPKVDGQGIDRIAVAFSGEIMLDRSDPADVALYNKLTLQKNVELRVAGRVNGTGAKGATNREGDLDVVVGKKTIKVETVYVLTPEELS